MFEKVTLRISLTSALCMILMEMCLYPVVDFSVQAAYLCSFLKTKENLEGFVRTTVNFQKY